MANLRRPVELLPTIANYCQLLLTIANYCLPLPTIAYFCQLLPTFANYCQNSIANLRPQLTGTLVWEIYTPSFAWEIDCSSSHRPFRDHPLSQLNNDGVEYLVKKTS